MKKAFILLICLFCFVGSIESKPIKLKDVVNELIKPKKKKKKTEVQTVCPNQTSAKETIIYSADEEIREFLKVHNNERALFGLQPLEWSSDLAKTASSWVKIIHDKNVMQHSKSSYGENIFWGSNKDFNMVDAANAWLSEKPLLKSNYYESPAGHYTQMIWRNTQKVGAAIYKGKNGTYVVANYYPAGNVIGEPIK